MLADESEAHLTRHLEDAPSLTMSPRSARTEPKHVGQVKSTHTDTLLGQPLYSLVIFWVHQNLLPLEEE